MPEIKFQPLGPSILSDQQPATTKSLFKFQTPSLKSESSISAEQPTFTKSLFNFQVPKPLHKNDMIASTVNSLQQNSGGKHKIFTSPFLHNVPATYASIATDDKSNDDTPELDLSLMDSLVAGKSKTDATIDGIKRDIEHAPLLSAGLVVKHVKDLVPQFGFLGSRSESEPHDAKVFHNINVPFSTFICGVQGSGKSHTTACMLENALIPSRTLGVLQSPISALVFSYGQSQTVRGDFDVSEAVHLAASRPDFPGHCVKKVTVMVSPTNLAMRIRYEKQGHNIRVLPLWVNAKTLDISVLRALMAVDDKAVTLYMAQVESILREIGVTVQAVRESSYCIS
jgi:hypothetical protein